MSSQQPPAPPPGPPPGSAPQPPAGAPQPGYAAPPQSSGKATAALILGIVGILICPVICSVLAIIFGKQAMDEIDATPGMTGRGMAKAGFILGIVSLSLSALFILIVLASGS